MSGTTTAPRATASLDSSCAHSRLISLWCLNEGLGDMRTTTPSTNSYRSVVSPSDKNSSVVIRRPAQPSARGYFGAADIRES
jgi:hypothetical protein